jgi:hypothetical protein
MRPGRNLQEILAPVPNPSEAECSPALSGYACPASLGLMGVLVLKRCLGPIGGCSFILRPFWSSVKGEACEHRRLHGGQCRRTSGRGTVRKDQWTGNSAEESVNHGPGTLPREPCQQLEGTVCRQSHGHGVERERTQQVAAHALFDLDEGAGGGVDPVDGEAVRQTA